MLYSQLAFVSALLLSPCAVALVTLPNGHQFLGRPHLDARPHADAPFVRRSRSAKGATGREKRATYATVRCDSLYKWSLCDGADKCTDMGSVAPGTACIDGAMAFDPNGSQGGTTTPVSDSDSNSDSADGSSLTDDSTTSQAAPPSVVINAAVQKPAATAAATSTSRRRKHRKTSKKTTSLATAARKQAAAAPTIIAAAKQAASPLEAASDLITGGFATFFYQAGGIGACGQAHADSDFIVALALARYGTGSNDAPDCGRRVRITNTDNGKTVDAAVADACPGCRNFNSLDLSVAAFDAIADQATGIVPIKFAFLD